MTTQACFRDEFDQIEGLLTEAQFCDLYAVRPRTTFKLQKAGAIVVVYVGGRRRITRASAARWAASLPTEPFAAPNPDDLARGRVKGAKSRVARLPKPAADQLAAQARIHGHRHRAALAKAGEEAAERAGRKASASA